MKSIWNIPHFIRFIFAIFLTMVPTYAHSNCMELYENWTGWDPLTVGLQQLPYLPIAKFPYEPSKSWSSPAVEVSQDGQAVLYPHLGDWSGADVKVEDAEKPEPTVNLQLKKSSRATMSYKVHREKVTFISRYEGLPSFKAIAISDDLGLSTGLVVSLSSQIPNAEVNIFVRLSYMSLKYKLKVPSQPTTFKIPWTEFTQYPYSAFTEKELGFSTDGPELNLKIHGPIIFERDIEHSPQRRKVLSKFAYRLDAHYEFPKSEFPRPEGYTLETAEGIITKGINNLFTSTKQEINLERALKEGGEAILAEVRRRGFVPLVLSKKTENRFFDAVSEAAHNYTSDPLDPNKPHKELPPLPIVPIESGDFGIEHGELAHALQILTMTEGMSEKELALFRYVYASIFIPSNAMIPGWTFWDIVFDAPGNFAANAPRWWRDKLERYQRSKARRFFNFINNSLNIFRVNKSN